ncbi:hypothetical protein CN489_24935 [Bacillus cereus]|nr:hypothetical protein CN489_24935 [Bacillus cereus]PFF53763.1 hypothetical protein CN350_27205 [Bacillus cereus]PGM85743.1 hypothetical protein CN956_00490 [Bacillus cereus]
MARKKQPKYNVGDIVVITLYGTVGKITKVKLYFYYTIFLCYTLFSSFMIYQEAEGKWSL